MSFFYNLNNKLNAIRELPSVTHGQLNERDMSRAAKGYEKYGKQGMEALAKAGREGKDLDKVRAKFNKYDESMAEGNHSKDAMELNPDFARVGRKPGVMGKMAQGVKRVADKIMPGDEDLLRDLERKTGGRRPAKEGAPMTAKQKSFAALAEPRDKITFADKIAGAKKEVDEMLGDVAAEAMKQALGGGKGRNAEVGEEASQGNAFTAHKRPRAEKPAVGTVTHGRKHDTQEIPGGRRVTRRTDSAGISVGADDEQSQSGEKRGRGRPKGPAKAPERVTGGATKHKGGRKTNEGENESDDIKQAMAMLKKAGYTVEKAAEQVDEKAVSKKQQRFMGMVSAAKKGEKPASKEVAKTAQSMNKKDAEDFASTKHKGLPEKAKSESKKEVEETSDSAPAKDGGMKFGGGIYDSMNRDLEHMIAESMARLDESMNISMNISNDDHGGPKQSLTVTATDGDAMKLSQLLKSAGLGSGDDQGYGGSGYQSACGCSEPGCGCEQQEMEEAYGDVATTENAPDYPTQAETSADPFQYSGGINKPKATGQTTVPVLASQDQRQESYAAEEEDAIKRMMEMAGVKKKEVDEEKTDEGNLFTKGLADDNVKIGDKIPGTNAVKKKDIDESIFAMTANLWKSYKG